MNNAHKTVYQFKRSRNAKKKPWSERLCDHIMIYNWFGALSQCLTIINDPQMPHFPLRRWSSTVSIGCMTSWPRTAWRRPPTSTLAPCLWDTRSLWAATSSSPPPSGLSPWGISCSGFSRTWTRAAGTCNWESAVSQAVGAKCIAHLFNNYRVQEISTGTGNTAVLCLLPSDTDGYDPTKMLKWAF